MAATSNEPFWRTLVGCLLWTALLGGGALWLDQNYRGIIEDHGGAVLFLYIVLPLLIGLTSGLTLRGRTVLGSFCAVALFFGGAALTGRLNGAMAFLWIPLQLSGAALGGWVRHLTLGKSD